MENIPPLGVLAAIRRVDNPPREDEALAEGQFGRGSLLPFFGGAKVLSSPFPFNTHKSVFLSTAALPIGPFPSPRRGISPYLRPSALSDYPPAPSFLPPSKLPSLERTKKNQKRKQKERKKNATPLRRRQGFGGRTSSFLIGESLLEEEPRTVLRRMGDFQRVEKVNSPSTP